MKKLLFLLLLFPLALSAQNVSDSLHKYTDSFLFYRCQVRIHKEDNTGFWINKRERYREITQSYYNLLNPNRTKTNFRFQNPNKYFACSCGPVDSVLERCQDSINYYTGEWEHSGHSNKADYVKIRYFSRELEARMFPRKQKP
jgi:hypothetical protein